MKHAAVLLGLVGFAAAAQGQFGRAVSENGANDSFLSESIFNAAGTAYDGNAYLTTYAGGDMFGITTRSLGATAPNGIPFDMLDDSLSIFPGDTRGIIGELDDGRFFGVADASNTVGGTGTHGAEWTFNIAGGSGLSMRIDMAAMGDFEASTDNYRFSYSIDGSGFSPLFDINPDEAIDFTYTMDGGAMFTENDPLRVNGGTILSNDFATFTAAIAGTGSVLTIRFETEQDAGGEVFAFRNMEIVPAPASLALLGLGGLAAARRRRA